jgi:hypothetical protein
VSLALAEHLDAQRAAVVELGDQALDVCRGHADAEGEVLAQPR